MMTDGMKQDAPRGCWQNRAVFPFVIQIVTIAIGFIAFILSAMVVSECDFFKITGIELTFGLAKIGLVDMKTCYELDEFLALYPEYETYMTTSWKAAKGMGAVAAALSGVTMLMSFFMLFFKFPTGLFKTIGGLYTFCFFAQMLTLLVLNTELCTQELKCKLRGNGIASIVAAIFFLAIGILVSICPTPKLPVIVCGDCCKEEDNGGDCCGEQSVQVADNRSVNRSIEGKTIFTHEQDVGAASTITETYNADGTVTITEERVNPDGTKTTTVTTRPATSV